MPAEREELLTIGQLAERAGLRTSHIRCYEKVGVIPEPERVAGQRRYRPETLHRLLIIEVAQRAGLSLQSRWSAAAELAEPTGAARPHRRGTAGVPVRRLQVRRIDQRRIDATGRADAGGSRQRGL